MFQKLKDLFKSDQTDTDKERALSLSDTFSRISEAVYFARLEDGQISQVLDIYMEEDDQERMFAIVVTDGQLYRQDVLLVTRDEVILAPPKKLSMEARALKNENHLTKVYRTTSGELRWLSIASTSALNRDGEIDSRQLFDSFKAYIDETGEYPILNFWHQGEASRLGIADYVNRDDNLYIASGVFDDTPIGRAAAAGVAREPDYWGNSIEFTAFDGDLIRVVSRDNVSITIPVFTSGVNTAISLLPESVAAAWGTSHITRSYGGHMNEQVYADLLRLVEDEELAQSFAAQIDERNREINDRMIHRSSETAEEQAEEVETEVEESPDVEEVEEVEEDSETVEEEEVNEEPDEIELVLDDSVIPLIVADVSASDEFSNLIETRVSALVADYGERLDAAHAEILVLRQELSALQAVNVAREAHEEDAPAGSRQRKVSYVKRTNSDNEEAPQVASKSHAETASDTLAKIRGEA